MLELQEAWVHQQEFLAGLDWKYVIGLDWTLCEKASETDQHEEPGPHRNDLLCYWRHSKLIPSGLREFDPR